MNNEKYKEILFRIFLNKYKKDYGDYINKDTRTYANHDDFIQMRAISPIYTENGKTMSFEIRNTWLRIEVITKVNDGQMNKSFILYRNIFKMRNDYHKYHIINLWNISKQNTIDLQLENTPPAKTELRKIKLNNIILE